jgi:photosystem II stability/assembly factor-like uncharacterized protein
MTLARTAGIATLSILLTASVASAQKKQPPKAAATPTPSALSTLNADHFKALEFRNIGPANMGGRVDDFAVVESNPSTFFVGMASAGILKTTNGGTTFETVFTNEDVHSIGDLALAPSDPSVLYVGTGEPNNRQSTSWGGGVYKSTDAGKTFQYMGLKETQYIGRVVVHPTNPDIAYVAALGRLYGPNKERGVYKTTDGGKTWTNVKFLDEDTGVIDIAIDPESPGTLYAGSYQRRRTPFGYSGGGPGGGLFKTTDGGATWKKLTTGLPSTGDMGRIGVTVYKRDPRIVMALIEHRTEFGVYRSEDKGETWVKLSNSNPRPSYYSQIHMDPNNDQRIWVLGANMYNSEDGGRTWRQNLVQRIHGDYHALWINPANSNHVIAGSDGGTHQSYDRGRTWDHLNTVPTGQFYEISADNEKPYNVCGGLQDNGTWHGPSRTLVREGIQLNDWRTIGGGDGFFCVIDPVDASTVYVESQDGSVQRVNLKTMERASIRPTPADPKEKYRFNWNSPIVVSKFDHNTVFYGGNKFFVSKDRGDSWTEVSGDLTNNEKRDEKPIFGKTAKEFMSRNDGVVHWGTATTIAQSPLKAEVLWFGADDGNLHVTQDMGKTWTKLTDKVPGVPKGTYVSRVEPSRTNPGAAYVAFDGHRADDFNAYVYFTPDFGATWKNVTANLPAGGTVSVVREHPKNPEVLFAGTEMALWASFNRGGSWMRIKSGLPTVPVDDIFIHPTENDIILATHGRSVWILDNVSALAGMGEAVAAKPLHLFENSKGTQWRIAGVGAGNGHKVFNGPNPPDGSAIQYWLKDAAGEKDTMTITITDAKGEKVRDIVGTKTAGLNRVMWDLRHQPPPAPEGGAGFGGGGGGGGGGFGGGGPRGPLVPPGQYNVKVTAGTHTSESLPITVEEDPRIQISEADRKAWYDMQMATTRLAPQLQLGLRTVNTLGTQLREIKTQIARNPRATDAVKTALQTLLDKVEGLGGREPENEPPGFAGAPLADAPETIQQRIGFGFGGFGGGMTAAPTPTQKAAFERAQKELAAFGETMRTITQTDVPALNKLLFDAGIGRINLQGGGPGGGGRRPPEDQQPDERDDDR